MCGSFDSVYCGTCSETVHNRYDGCHSVCPYSGGISYFEVFPGYAVSYGTGNSDGIFVFRDHLRAFLRMAEETGTKQKENYFCLTTLYISAIMYKNKETGACVTG